MWVCSGCVLLAIYYLLSNLESRYCLLASSPRKTASLAKSIDFSSPAAANDSAIIKPTREI